MASLVEIQTRFTDEIKYIDDVAQIVLKGHLVMEEVMTTSIATFLLHGEFVELCRLQFHQKLLLCRAMSTSDQNNEMWNLIASINTLRNHLSHSLDPAQRSKRIESLSSHYAQQFPNNLPEQLELDTMPREAAICMLAISGALGFLHSHADEIHRFKSVILNIDKILNKGVVSET